MKECNSARFGRFVTLVARHKEFTRDFRRQLRGTRRADKARECDQVRLLRETHQRRGGAHEVEALEERPQGKLPEPSAAYRLSRPAGAANLRACAFDQLTVLHARGADGFAGTAIQALPHLLDEPGAEQVEPRFTHRLHET